MTGDDEIRAATRRAQEAAALWELDRRLREVEAVFDRLSRVVDNLCADVIGSELHGDN